MVEAPWGAGAEHPWQPPLSVCPTVSASPLHVQNLTTDFIMAPFLRISFNSYELGSLQTEEEGSQPFCAVKMKEALTTGTVGRVTRGAGAQREGRLTFFPRSFLSS